MTLHVHESDGRIEVVVDRPETLNAIDFEAMTALEEVLEGAEGRTDLRLFTMRGAGERAFVSGGDLVAFAELTTDEDARAMSTRMKAILARIESLPCWTLAAVNGPAYGGGCETSLAFDFRLAASHATFGFTQGRFAVPPGWGGLTRLVELVGHSRALGWLATNAIVSAGEAGVAGLANWVADDFETALADLTANLTRPDPAMIATLKEGADRARDLPRDEALDAELAPFARHWAGDEHHRRVRAFLERSES